MFPSAECYEAGAAAQNGTKVVRPMPEHNPGLYNDGDLYKMGGSFAEVVAISMSGADIVVEVGYAFSGAIIHRIAFRRAARGVGSSARHPLSAINPLGGTTNCVNCAVALNETLAGSRAAAVLGNAVPLNQAPAAVGKRAFDAVFSRIGGVEKALGAAGSGARAVVVGVRANGTAHAFNAMNQGGKVVFLDGQAGTAAVTTGFRSFYYLGL